MRPTIYDIARAAGVSSTMASRILRGSRTRQDKLAENVKNAAVALGYQPNRAASSLRTMSSGIVGLIVPELRNPFFSAYAESLSRNALKHDYVLMSLVADEADVQLVAKRLMEYRVTALVSAVPSLIEGLHSMGWDGLLIAVSRQPDSSLIPYVGMDDYAAGQLIIEHLEHYGHQKIMFFAESSSIPSTFPRIRGLTNYASKDQNLMIEYVNGVDDMTIVKIQDALAKFNPTAIIGGSDAITLRIYNAIGQLGLRIPEHISLVSFDGTFAVEDLIPISLTSVIQPIDLCTTKVMEWIDNNLAEKDLLKPYLVTPKLRIGLTTKNLLIPQSLSQQKLPDPNGTQQI